EGLGLGRLQKTLMGGTPPRPLTIICLGRTRFVSPPLTACLFVNPEGSYPKPSISVSPGGVIPVGGNITIRCQHQHLGMRFLLYKAGVGKYLNYTDPAGYMAEFPITSARREHGGSYTCRYSNRTIQTAYSEPSDPVQIIVAGQGYPKPSISLSPSGGVSLGGAVSVWCRGQRRGVRFVLNKERRHFPPVDSDDNEAVFSISNVRREDRGSYSCYYHSRSEPFAVSYPSDPVELVVRGEGLGSAPSISLSPTGVTAPGADVTIRCQGQRRDVRFFLHKAGDQNPQQHMDPAGDGAEFRIPTVGRQHGGSYNCSYRPRSEQGAVSPLCNTCLLLKAGREYPKRPIWVSPSRVVALGGNITIRCESQYPGMDFFLRKAGHPNPQMKRVYGRTVAEFPISSVSRENGGSYTCDYRPITAQNRSSYLSDPVEIIVGGEGGAQLSVPAPSPTRSQTLRGSLHQWDTQSQALIGDRKSRRVNLPLPPVHALVLCCPLLVQITPAEIKAQHQQPPPPSQAPHPCCPVGGEWPSAGTRGSRLAHGGFWFVSLCRKRSRTETKQVGTRLLPTPARPAGVTGLLGSVPAQGGEWGLVVRTGWLGARTPGFSPWSGRGVGSSGWGKVELGNRVQCEAGWGALWLCWGISLRLGGYDIYKGIFSLLMPALWGC
uniref:Ig-like domain-containing protein n=1 Tax=Chrysemys picta bellii TaxID=8478 RepID=A0A8C3HV15_CHRPI